MTNQEAFNQVWAWANRPVARKSERADGVCLHRGEDGNRCFIGSLIPDDVYTPEFDTEFTLNDVQDNTPGLDEVSIDLLADLRNCHDASGHHAKLTWQKEAVARLTRVSMEWELIIPEGAQDADN